MTIENTSQVRRKYVASTQDCSLGATEQFVLDITSTLHYVFEMYNCSSYFGLCSLHSQLPFSGKKTILSQLILNFMATEGQQNVLLTKAL